MQNKIRHPHQVLRDSRPNDDESNLALHCEVYLLEDGSGMLVGVPDRQQGWALSFLRTQCWLRNQPLPQLVHSALDLDADIGWATLTDVDFGFSVGQALPLPHATQREVVTAADRGRLRQLTERRRQRA